jgi:hypothetical protein
MQMQKKPLNRLCSTNRPSTTPGGSSVCAAKSQDPTAITCVRRHPRVHRRHRLHGLRRYYAELRHEESWDGVQPLHGVRRGAQLHVPAPNGLSGDALIQHEKLVSCRAYVPAISKLDGRYRIVEVKANAPGHERLSVRTRTGYFVPSAPALSETVGHDSHIGAAPERFVVHAHRQ